VRVVDGAEWHTHNNVMVTGRIEITERITGWPQQRSVLGVPVTVPWVERRQFDVRGLPLPPAPAEDARTLDDPAKIVVLLYASRASLRDNAVVEDVKQATTRAPYTLEHIIWPNLARFIVLACMCAAIAAVTIRLCLALRVWHREVTRSLDMTTCKQCGYDLGGLPEARACPECGAEPYGARPRTAVNAKA
jgi:hypothetical protein